MSAPILSVRDLRVHFLIRVRSGILGRWVVLKALDGVSFDLVAGETLGVVGESGCGKSTLGRAVMQLIPPSAGSVVWMGDEIAGLGSTAMLPRRREMQIVFQDPLASLDPRMTIGDIIAEPLRSFHPELRGEARRDRVREMLAKVGLSPQMINRYPHEFSGGQCQRIGVARAMILRPKLIVCDEPVSALDVSIQGQIINLLRELQRDFGVALIFISHNLAVVRHVSHRILVLYLGRAMEIADRDSLYQKPLHPYSKALISAVPLPDPDAERARDRIVLHGDLPSPLTPPSGCVFRTRCPRAEARCAESAPPLEDAGAGRQVACHFWR